MHLSDEILKQVAATLLGHEGEYSDVIKIKSQEWKSGSKPGEDNFTCLLSLLNLTAQYNGRECSFDGLIVKHPPEEPSRIRFLKTAGLCDKEIHAYQHLLPKLQKVALSGLGEKLTFPDCYYANSDNLV